LTPSAPASTDSSDKLVPEGIEGRVPYKGTLLAIIHQSISRGNIATNNLQVWIILFRPTYTI
jgi:IMP dehydrogenase/GMP reductase